MASSQRRAAVLGRPIVHSLSPTLHRAAYSALGLDWAYEAIDCGADDLAAVLGAHAGWAGFSCTMPLKHAALSCADEASGLARAVGAANTLLPCDGGGWRAENTDVDGILGALAEHGGQPSTVTIVGAGGTAQAAVAAVAQLGIASCAVLVRDSGRAGAATATAERVGVRVDVARLGPDQPALDADLVISTIPPGAADSLAAHRWRPGQLVLDVVYDPWPTSLAAAVHAAGGTVISGASMLLHQAARQVELMTGSPPPVDAMRAALRAVLPAGL